MDQLKAAAREEAASLVSIVQEEARIISADTVEIEKITGREILVGKEVEAQEKHRADLGQKVKAQLVAQGSQQNSCEVEEIAPLQVEIEVIYDEKTCLINQNTIVNYKEKTGNDGRYGGNKIA